MKNFTLSIALMMMVLGAFAQKISRGPEIGEIYFLGPTATVMYDAIYRSTDFGETIICMDSTTQITTTIASIAADKGNGGVYYTSMNQNLYYSSDYGGYGSWDFKSSDISYIVNSGVEPGLIFDHVEAHSDDFGDSFIYHNLNGYFGELLFSETDSLSNIGYVVVEKWGEWDTLFLQISYDTFETVQLQNAFCRYEEPLGWLSRGLKSGELLSLVLDKTTIKFSNDFGYSWEVKNNLYLNNYTTVNITGGRQNGEVYLLVTYIKQMGQIKHIYIYHSLDYGETFTIYHPFSFGPNPFYVAFEADNNTGFVPLTIQFNDESSGEDLSWEWDFENDGIIDSYEQNPKFIYTDTGYYDVKLTVTNPYNQYSLLKEVFIHVKDTTTSFTEDILQEVKIFPNPLNDKLRIEIPKTSPESRIFIYNLIGEIIFETEMYQNTFEINFTNCPKGIYIICIKDHRKSINYKIIKK